MAVDRIKGLDGVTYLQALLGGLLLHCLPDVRVSPHMFCCQSLLCVGFNHYFEYAISYLTLDEGKERAKWPEGDLGVTSLTVNAQASKNCSFTWLF